MGKLLKPVISLFIIAGLILILYVITMDMTDYIYIVKAAIIYIFSALLFLSWFAYKSFQKIHSSVSLALTKYENIEKLLIDLRDGTRSFYRERRRAPRIEDVMKARITGNKADELARILNISPEGALLKTAQDFQAGEMMDLNIYLPLFVQPIDARAQVVRAFRSEDEPYLFNAGIKFLNIDRFDRDRLIETVDLLSRSRPISRSGRIVAK